MKLKQLGTLPINSSQAQEYSVEESESECGQKWREDRPEAQNQKSNIKDESDSDVVIVESSSEVIDLTSD